SHPATTALCSTRPAGYLDRLDPLPENASLSDGQEAADLVLLFASNRAQLERDFAAAFSALKAGGALWVGYPAAGDTDLSPKHGWGVLGAAGLAATDQTSLDAAWDALLFKRSAAVRGSTMPAADMLPVGRRASPVFRAVRLVARPLFWLMFRFDVKGLERVPNRAFVLICNHLGWMDAVSLLLLFPAAPRVHYLADPTSMMKNRPLWTLVRAAGGIVPVDRAQRGNVALFRHVGRCLDSGGVVAIFPEGDFGPREGVMLPFKKGFAHFAIEAGVPVVPVALAGMKEIWLGKRLFVRVGEPIATKGRTVDDVHRLGEQAVAALMPTYHEPAGRKPLRRWLTGLF
ncbi:MAG TPA: 1-acyl-sn-glycerol-3-phosphate acyltransferase, partial [Reyranella sp.]|nr:1-acyl-sn-glycerol-3-phosphate acyltransferase [Reyranella sp.]